MLDEVLNKGKPDEVADDGKPDLLDNPNLGMKGREGEREGRRDGRGEGERGR